MIGKKCLPCFAVLGLMLAAPAQATLPPPTPPEYGAYGPLTVCEGDLSIAVRPNEAVHLVGPIFRIINDDHLIAATPMVLPTSAFMLFDGPVKHGVFTTGSALANLAIAFRYSGELPPAAAPYVAFARDGFGKDDVRYAVETRSGASRSDGMVSMLIVASPSFDGTDADKTILARFQLNAADASACVRPADLSAGKADYGVASFVRSFDNPFYAGLYPARPDDGPGYHCQGGIGFAFEAGEQLRRPWKSLRNGRSYLIRDGVAVTMSGPFEPMRRTDPDDPNEHPAGLLHKSAVTLYPSRGVGPPYAPPGVREDGSWLIELGKEKNSRLEVLFPAGDKGRLGFALIERLEFVGDSDPRCTTPSTSK
ncbi:MAG: hypothetical protein JHD35_06020 [Sphingopyxis sp.]|nr:hypothetical protein [Sphingopyxis sp.]